MLVTITFKKAISDLRYYPGRFLLVVFALIIGIWGVGSILVSYFILSKDLTQNHINTRPAHATLISVNFNKLNLTRFNAKPEIESAEFRDFSIHRIEVYPDHWIPLWIHGVNDFKKMNLAHIYAQQGSTVPPPGSMLIERNGLLISNIKAGSHPRVRLNKKVTQIPVSGISFDPAMAPATQDHHINAYMNQMTYSKLTGEPLNQRLIIRLRKAHTRQDIENTVATIVKEFKLQGINISKIKIPEPNAHPHQWQLDTIILLQGSISLLAFLMAAVLVSQLMASVLAKQIRQIGVLKAIGASRSQVLRIYFIMLVLLGISAGMIGTPLAVISGYGFSYFIAYQLNFDILTTQLPVYIYFTLITISLFLPLLLSLPTILNGSRTSVLSAINNYGISLANQSNKILKQSNTLLPDKLNLAFRNNFRQKKRLLITLLTMALGVAIFNTGFNVRQSLATLLQETNDSMRHDVQVVFKDSIPPQQAINLFKSVPNIKTIETWNGGRGEIQSRLLASRSDIGIVALPHDTQLMKPKILQGHWLNNSKTANIVMNTRAWNTYKTPRPGTILDLTLKGKKEKFKLVGIIEEFDQAKIYIDQQQYNTLFNPDNLVNNLMFSAIKNNYDDVMLLKKELEKTLAASDHNVLDVMSQAERLKIVYDHLDIILTTILFFSFIVLLVSALGMASSMGISIMERTREIGVLRAIGATPDMIHTLFVLEGIIVSVAAIFAGLLLAWPLSIAASKFFGDLILVDTELTLVMSPQGFWITLFTTLLFGWLASRLPARNAIKISTHNALSYQ